MACAITRKRTSGAPFHVTHYQVPPRNPKDDSERATNTPCRWVMYDPQQRLLLLGWHDKGVVFSPAIGRSGVTRASRAAPTCFVITTAAAAGHRITHDQEGDFTLLVIMRGQHSFWEAKRTRSISANFCFGAYVHTMVNKRGGEGDCEFMC